MFLLAAAVLYVGQERTKQRTERGSSPLLLFVHGANNGVSSCWLRLPKPGAIV